MGKVDRRREWVGVNSGGGGKGWVVKKRKKTKKKNSASRFVTVTPLLSYPILSHQAYIVFLHGGRRENSLSNVNQGSVQSSKLKAKAKVSKSSKSYYILRRCTLSTSPTHHPHPHSPSNKHRMHPSDHHAHRQPHDPTRASKHSRHRPARRVRRRRRVTRVRGHARR